MSWDVSPRYHGSRQLITAEVKWTGVQFTVGGQKSFRRAQQDHLRWAG